LTGIGIFVEELAAWIPLVAGHISDLHYTCLFQLTAPLSNVIYFFKISISEICMVTRTEDHLKGLLELLLSARNLHSDTKKPPYMAVFEG